MTITVIKDRQRGGWADRIAILRRGCGRLTRFCPDGRAPLTAQLLRGAGLSGRLRTEIDHAIERLTAAGAPAPTLATVLVGEDPSALAYRSSIERTLSRVQIAHRPVDFPLTIERATFSAEITRLSEDPSVTGVLVLMPLPPHLPQALVYEHLTPLKDVDGITPVNAGRMHMGLPALRPSTPQGGIELLDHYGIEIEGRRAVVIGRSNVVGRPLASLLVHRHATVTLCHRRTVDLPSLTVRADILCVAAGHAGLVTSDMVKSGAVVLDFGVNAVDDHITGDVAFDEVSEVAGAITPVPGGTGPVTALVLARNTVAAGFASLSGSLDAVQELTRVVAELGPRPGAV
jgi:methylenetetrahydrofolate dehydrogenase (NADP+) / methenyltetrahydrofolate cyclohydrolase